MCIVLQHTEIWHNLFVSKGRIMDTRQNMIVDNQTNKIITPDVISCTYNNQSGGYDVLFRSMKSYSYGYGRITWMKNPKRLEPALYRIAHLGNKLFGVVDIYVFEGRSQDYWHVCFENGSERDYSERDLVIIKSCFDDGTSKNVFSYLRKIAELSELKMEDGTNLLSKHYEKISSFMSEEMALAAYLNPNSYQNTNRDDVVPIFPFGCNASQYKAVKTALENKLSVIQGPPGTGKTLTILNIVANLLISGKTVQIVSNNESAITNILEKLSLPEYGMGFLAAMLGKSDNKKGFIQNQVESYPDLSDWNNTFLSEEDFIRELLQHSEKLNVIFQQQERLALAKQELQELKTEIKYFEQYTEDTNDNLTQFKIRKKLKSEKLVQLWQECQSLSETGKKIVFFFKIKCYFFYGISDWNIFKKEASKIINVLQNMFYQERLEEITGEIDMLERSLESKDAGKLMDEFVGISMTYLKGHLYNKYGTRKSRHVFCEDDLWKNPSEVQKEYPIVLSTTFSSRSSLCKEAYYDYMIMDEASQVDIATGALALSCAPNVVIVGDTKQLRNIVKRNIKNKSDAIFESFKIAEGYRYSKNSFLQSICEVLPTIPQTLLREHYRCHPKIINFCNYKFYGGKLVIMTSDKAEENVISVVKTVIGNHERDHMNQRQIDSVLIEVLPNLSYPRSDIGIIAPYNNQVVALKDALLVTGIDVATVHKFQGREKDAIILSTVDDEVTDFSDDPYLLNVAISRAKKQLYLVISGNEQPEDSNIFDLVSYIEYNNFSVVDSKLYSIFDYLYKQYTQIRIEYLKKHKRISEYDSENLMFALIQDTLKEQELTYLSVVCHLPLNMLIRNTELLSDEECRYVANNSSHLDFLIYNRLSKKPVLAIEVDGFRYHKAGTRQKARDTMKNHILEVYEIPYLRFATNGSREKERLVEELKRLLKL